MKINKEKTVAFVGCRNLTTPDGIPDRNLENVIRTELFYTIEQQYEEGKNTFLSGMDTGFEMLAAEVVMKYRRWHDEIKFYAIIPFEGQERDYSLAEQLRYKLIIENATGYVVISDQHTDKEDSYELRNDFLVDNSSELVVYSNNEPPALKKMMKSAKKKGTDVWNMYPELEGYFSTHNPVKTFLQDYPDVPSFEYGREGVIFEGHHQPFPVAFTHILTVECNTNNLYFTLDDGKVIIASLLSKDCHIKLGN